MLTQFCGSGIWTGHSGNSLSLPVTSGLSAGRFDNWGWSNGQGLGSSGSVFTHMSGSWYWLLAGTTIGLLAGTSTWGISMWAFELPHNMVAHSKSESFKRIRRKCLTLLWTSLRGSRASLLLHYWSKQSQRFTSFKEMVSPHSVGGVSRSHYETNICDWRYCCGHLWEIQNAKAIIANT